jgi:biopolymer transport protein ExbB
MKAGMKVVMFAGVMAVGWGAAPLLAATAVPGGGAAGDAVAGGSMLTHWVFPIFDYTILSMLGLASVAGVALAIDAMLNIRESKVAPPESTERLRQLIAGKDYKELMDFAATDNSFVSRALYAAIRRAHLKYAAMREGLESSVGEQTSDLFRRIEPLNVIGNIGPLLGLLGTVLGMIMAFYALRETQGVPDQAKLAGGIGTALWHTFFGLFVAIPCLVVYGFYRTRADKIATKAALVAEDLLEALRPDPTADGDPTARKKARAAREGSAAPVPQPMVSGEAS